METLLEQEIEVSKEEQKTSILNKAVLLSLKMSWLPQSRTISNKILNTTSDPTMISSTKKLFQSEELRRIANNRGCIATYLKYKSSPFPARNGNYLIPIDLLSEVEKRLVEHVKEEQKLIGLFVNVYDQAVKDAEALLGDQFNDKDYPSKDQVKEYFQFTWQYLEFSMSDKLKAIDKEMAERQEVQYRRTIRDAGIACEQLLAEQFIDLLSHQIERLTNTGDVNKDGTEKKKIYRDSSLQKLVEFISDLPQRNLTVNPELELAGSAVRDQVAGLTAEVIRTDDNIREVLLKEFGRVKGELEKVKYSYGSRSQQVWNKVVEESTVFRVLDKMDNN